MEFIVSLREGIIMVRIRFYLKYTFSHLILIRFNLEPVKRTTTFNNIINFFSEVRNCIKFKLQVLLNSIDDVFSISSRRGDASIEIEYKL